MTIALLTDGIPPFVMGGMQKHSFLLANYLAKSGVEVLLYHCVDPGSDVNDKQVLNAFDADARANLHVRTFEYSDTGTLPGHYLRAQRALSKRYFERLLQESSNLDFIYTKGFVGMELLKRRGDLPFECKIGVKFHGMNMYQRQPDFKGELTKYVLRKPVKTILNASDIVFSYGGKITDILTRIGIPKEKIVEVPSGIGQEAIRTSSLEARKDGVTRFVFVGRYDRVKGLPELYKALEQLPDTNWEMEFIGPIPESNRCDFPNTKYHGVISDQNELFNRLDEADVLVCPSISEGMPNVILEGMARGLAIIATDVGATSLLVKENGVLIPTADPNQISEAMLQLIHLNQTELTQLKANSIQNIRDNFTWEAIISRFLEFLKQLA